MSIILLMQYLNINLQNNHIPKIKILYINAINIILEKK